MEYMQDTLERIKEEREKYERLLELKMEQDRIKEIKEQLGNLEEPSKSKKPKNFAQKYVAFCDGLAGAFIKKKEDKNRNCWNNADNQYI